MKQGIGRSTGNHICELSARKEIQKKAGMWHVLCTSEDSQVFDFHELIIKKGCAS